MAGFLVPFGQALTETLGGIGKGKQLRDENTALRDQDIGTKLENQMRMLELQQALRQQKDLPAAMEALFGPKGKYIAALGDPGIKLFMTEYAKRLAGNSKSAEQNARTQWLLNKSDEYYKAGDKVKAQQYRDMATANAASFSPQVAGQMSGALQDPFKEIGEVLNLQVKEGAIEKQSQEAADRQAGRAQAAEYGLGRPSGPIAPNVARVIEETRKALALKGFSKDATDKVVDALKLPGSGTTTGAGPTVAPSGLPTSPAAAKKTLQSIPMSELGGLEGALDKGLATAAKEEMKTRRSMLMNANERKFVEQMMGSLQSAKNLEKAVKALPKYDKAQVLTYAHWYKSAGGWGMPQPWLDYFTSVGAAYWAIWNAGKGSGSQGGYKLMEKVSDHFPTANQKWFPDDPQVALGKVRQLLSGTGSGLIKQRDFILRRDFEARNGTSALFLNPDEEDIINKYRTVGAP